MRPFKKLQEALDKYPWLEELLVDCIKWAKDNDNVVGGFELTQFSNYFDKPQTVTQFIYKYGKGDSRSLTMNQVNEMVVLISKGELVDDISQPYKPCKNKPDFTMMSIEAKEAEIRSLDNMDIFELAQYISDHDLNIRYDDDSTDNELRYNIQEHIYNVIKNSVVSYLNTQSADFNVGYKHYVIHGVTSEGANVEYNNGTAYAIKVAKILSNQS